MKNILKLSLCALLTSSALYAQAADTLYGSEFLTSTPSSFSFPTLDLSQPTYASMHVTDIVTGSMGNQKIIEKLTLQFNNASTLDVTNFRNVNGYYIAVVEDAWVFRKLLVIVENVNFDQPDNFTVRLKVVEYTSNIDELTFAGGTELAVIHGNLIDKTPKKLVDKATLNVNGKELILSLKDRIGHYSPDPLNMPIPGYEHGFEIEATWMGHGTKTFFLPLPNNGSQTNNITPIRLNIEEINDPNGTIIILSVEYKDSYGGSFSSSQHLLNDILVQVF
ncbi:hypothetical protein [Colwellia psychrerythraea]|uniref:Uncharacterized protein n=1 Tax=Colwellia psychrerythraea TaxID=28229 RepID=A0A099KPQ1_COLPS|nr:hypothetical protein [Colwellia psychrerythraea]KGJ91907.1 hypothetical protein GAB14E_3064 [Colwellia psychrerythraea]